MRISANRVFSYLLLNENFPLKDNIFSKVITSPLSSLTPAGWGWGWSWSWQASYWPQRASDKRSPSTASSSSSSLGARARKREFPGWRGVSNDPPPPPPGSSTRDGA